MAGILIGENIKHLAKTVFEYGADITYVYDQPIFKHYRTESFMKALLECANKYKPEIILFGATSTGKDLASAVATDLPTGLTEQTRIWWKYYGNDSLQKVSSTNGNSACKGNEGVNSRAR